MLTNRQTVTLYKDYSYTVTKTAGDRRYFACINKLNIGCKARLAVDGEYVTAGFTGHNHEPDKYYQTLDGTYVRI